MNVEIRIVRDAIKQLTAIVWSLRFLRIVQKGEMQRTNDY